MCLHIVCACTSYYESAFRDDFMELCWQPSCLPYPEKGGRQSHLAIASKRWLKKCELPGGELASFKKAPALAGFLAIHASKKIETKGKKDEKGNSLEWALEDGKAESCAGQMANRLIHLLRHVSQAMNSKAPPAWLDAIFDEGTFLLGGYDEDGTGQDEDEEDEEGEEEAGKAADEDEDEETQIAYEDTFETQYDEESEEEQQAAEFKLDEKIDGKSSWIVDYSFETGKAYRVLAADAKKRKDFAVGFV